MKTLKKQIPLPNLHYGFEIEGGYPYEKHSSIRRLIRKIYKNNPVIIGRDGSVNVPDGHKSVEIKTPPMEEKEAFENLFALFGGLSKLGFITNSTCGLHVNFSEKNIFKHDWRDERMRKFCDRFISDFKTSYWKEKFRRKTNYFCIWNRYRPDFSTQSRAAQSVDGSRYHAINVTRLRCVPSARRIEVRIAGNANYHKKPVVLKQYLSEISNTAKIGFAHAIA